MKPNEIDYVYQEVPVKDIVVPEGHRPTDPAKVDSIAESIKQTGLLHPVGLTPDYRLIYGRHRLGAYQTLGFEHIPALVHAYGDDLHVELATIDENLQRSPLTELEEIQALTRRKQIFELLHPETAAGMSQANGSNRAQGRGPAKDVSDKLSPTFTTDTAAKTGHSRRTIERKAKIGEKLDPQAAELLRGTLVENNQSELKAMADLPAKKQRNVAKKIKAGKTTTVRTPTTSPGSQLIAQQGLKGLAMATRALRALGIHPAHADAIQRLRDALSAHASGRSPAPPDPKQQREHDTAAKPATVEDVGELEANHDVQDEGEEEVQWEG